MKVVRQILYDDPIPCSHDFLLAYIMFLVVGTMSMLSTATYSHVGRTQDFSQGEEYHLTTN
jgi:hypothetical protein